MSYILVSHQTFNGITYNLNKIINNHGFIYYPLHVILWALAISLLIVLWLGIDFMSNNFPTKKDAVKQDPFNYYIFNKENYEFLSMLVLSLSIVTFIFKTTLVVLQIINSWAVFMWILLVIILIHNNFNKLGYPLLNKIKLKYVRLYNIHEIYKGENCKKGLSYFSSFWYYIKLRAFYAAYYSIYKLRKNSNYLFWFLIISVATRFIVTNF